MSYSFIRIDDFRKSDLPGVSAEVNRTTEVFKNEEIDLNRIKLNQYLKECDGGTLSNALKGWCNNHKVDYNSITKKNNCVGGCIMTSDQEFFKKMGWDKENPTEEAIASIRLWANREYEFACQNFGKENILVACIHLDETTPHLQLYYANAVENPLIKQYARDDEGHVIKIKNDKGDAIPQYKRDERGKIVYEREEGFRLSSDLFWKERGGKNSYEILQDTHHDWMSFYYPELERGESSKETEKKHKTKNKWQYEQKVKKLDIEIELSENNLNELNTSIEKKQKEFENEKKLVEEELVKKEKKLKEYENKIDQNEQILKNQRVMMKENTEKINTQVELFDKNQIILDSQKEKVKSINAELDEHKGLLDIVYTLLEYFSPLERLIELLGVLKKHKDMFFEITDNILENEDYMDSKEKDALDYAWQAFSENKSIVHHLKDLMKAAEKLKEQEDKLRKSATFRKKTYEHEI